MSTFAVNRHGLDQVTLQFTTTGRNECSVNLKDALLDETKSYVFCVDHLNVPLDSISLTNNTKDVELFRVIRRNCGASLNQTAAVSLDWDGLDVYTLDQRFYDVPSFVRSINNWARGVETKITTDGHEDLRQYGAPPDSNRDAPPAPLRLLPGRDPAEFGTYDMIRFLLGLDGTLSINMSHDFINNYILQFSRYGAEILGLNENLSEVTHRMISQVLGVDVIAPETTDFYLAVTTTAAGLVYDTASWLGATEESIIRVLATGGGGNIQGVDNYMSQRSLYQVLDQRVYVSLSSHLPMLNNLAIREGKETVSRNICDVFFSNKITSSMNFDEEGVFTNSQVTNVLFAGQFPLIKKSDRTKQFHKLLTSFSLRFFRFSLWMTYRRYNSVKNEWLFETKRFPVDKTQYWDFSLRFISLV